MNTSNENQHHVSQVLLRRFTISGRLQKYNIQTEKWKPVSPKKVFSEFGYNQLLVCGQTDNTLEDAFSRVETPLPKTFEALERAATTPSTQLPGEIYENMCWYCAFLGRISPFAKAKAPADFVVQINMELENGRIETLRDVLNMPAETIEFYREACSRGGRIIIDSEDFLQVVYRIQFRHGYQHDYKMFRYWAKWAICKSPIEFPISDMALVPIHTQNATFYILPIGPRLLLKGQVNNGTQDSSSQTFISGVNLTTEQAEFCLDTICLSAVTELVSPRIIPDILAIRERAKAKGIAFNTIVDPALVISAGLKDFSSNFGLRVVSVEEYVKFIHSFVKPQTPPSQSGG